MRHAISGFFLSVIFVVYEKSTAVPAHAMRTCRRNRGVAPLILNLSSRWEGEGGECQHHASVDLNPENKPGTHWTGGWLGPRADRDDLQERKISCPWRDPKPIPSNPHVHYYNDAFIAVSLQYKAVVCIYPYIHTVMNTTILQLVAIYKIQLHVSALYISHHQAVQRTYWVYDMCVVILEGGRDLVLNHKSWD